MTHTRKDAEDKFPNPEAQQDPVTLARAEYETLLQQVKEAEALKERLMRTAADYENAKKRVMRERDEFVKALGVTTNGMYESIVTLMK